MKLEFSIHNYLERLEQEGKSPNSIKNAKTDLNILAQYATTHNLITLDQISKYDCIDAYSQHINQIYPSTNTARRKLLTFRRFLSYLFNHQKISTDLSTRISLPEKKVFLPSPAKMHHIQKAWSSLLSPLKEKTPLTQALYLRNQIIFTLIFFNALDVSKLVKLKHANFNFGPPLKIRDLIHPEIDQALPDFFEDLILQYLRSIRLLGQETQGQDGFFFNANQFQILDQKLTPRGVELIFKELSRKLKISITPKNLRQAGIYRWIHMGKSKKEIIRDLQVSPQYDINQYFRTKDQNIFSVDLLEKVFYDRKDYSSSLLEEP